MLLSKLLEHVELFERKWGDTKDINILKKFYKVYVKDFPMAGALRVELMDAKNIDQIRTIIKRILV